MKNFLTLIIASTLCFFSEYVVPKSSDPKSDLGGTYITVGSLHEYQNRIIKKIEIKNENNIFTGNSGLALQGAICLASPGDTIFIDENVTINANDLGARSIIIDKAITIASNRGEDRNGILQKGALIKRGDIPGAQPLFLIKKGAGEVRISGLRIKGSQSADYGQICIRIRSHDKVCIEGCEIYSWSAKAIELFPDRKDPIPNQLVVGCNYIHDIFHSNTPRTGTGYGVSIVTSEAVIFGNWLCKNRHDIAGSGLPNCGYEAYRNLFGPEGKRHNVDMHGIDDHTSQGEIDYWNKYWNYKEDNKKNVGGNFLSVHHNAFRTGDNGDDIETRGCLINGYNIWSNKFWNSPKINIETKGNCKGRCKKNAKGKVRITVNQKDLSWGVRTQNFDPKDYPYKWNIN